MFINWIKKCFGGCSSVDNNESIQFNQIKKLIIVETAEKLPDIYDKWKVIFFFEKANKLIETVLGGNIEFIIQNPNEIPCNKTKSVKYQVKTFNFKTKKCINRLSFHFKHDPVQMGPILCIKSNKNDEITETDWNFIESVFFNMGYQTHKKFYKNL
jgi:hypothetical protein